MTIRDIVLVVIIPLALAELGPWCGWLAARLLPWAARLRYGDTHRADVRREEWSGDLDEIPGQLTKLAYAVGQLVAGSAAFAWRQTKKERSGDLTSLTGMSSAEKDAIASQKRRLWFRIGPPRRLTGLTTRGHALRFGVLLPPAEGPARRAALEAEGRRLLAEARRGYGTVLRQVLVAAGSAVPPPVDLARPWSPGAERALVSTRRAGWERTRRMLAAASSDGFVSSPPGIPGAKRVATLEGLENEARAALDAAVAAFNHLEDTDLVGDAHACAHTIGELVAGLFGCRPEQENDRWFDVCRLSLMHLRVGMTVGFTAHRLCSICGRDITACDHVPGTAYSVVAAQRADWSCTICDSVNCVAHTIGIAYPIFAHAVVREVDQLKEISTVARPRDPLARIEAVEIPAYAVASLPHYDAANATLHCERCAAPCTGFTSVEEALGFA